MTKKVIILILVMISAAVLMTFTGCKKTNPLNNTSCDWRKEDINALIPFVPADTPVFLATTRQINMQDDIYATSFKRITYRTDTLKYVARKMAMDDVIFYKMKDAPLSHDKVRSALTALDLNFSTMLHDILMDYENKAQDIGLNPNHYDAVFFLNGTRPIFKFSADDGQKLKSWLQKELDSPMNYSISYKNVKSSTNEWTIFTIYADPGADNPDIQHKYEQIKNECETLKKDPAKSEEYRSCEITVSQLGTRLEYKDQLPVDGPRMVDIAIHFDNHIITILAGVNSTDYKVLDNYLIIPKQAVKPPKYEELSNNTLATGFINLPELIQRYRSNPNDISNFARSLYGTELSAGCMDELQILANRFPKLDLTLKTDHTIASLETRIHFANESDIQVLKNYQKPGFIIPNQHLMAGINLNADISKLLNDIRAWANQLSTMPFKCDLFSSIPDYAQSFTETLDNPMLSPITANLDGLSNVTLYLDNYYYYHPEIKKDFLLSISGSNLDFSLSILSGMLMFDESAKDLRNALANYDTIQKVDLPVEGDEPIHMNVLRTQKTLTAATEKYDLTQTPKDFTSDAPLLSLYLGNRWGLAFMQVMPEDCANPAKMQYPEMRDETMAAMIKVCKMAYTVFMDTSLSVYTADDGANLTLGVDLAMKE